MDFTFTTDQERLRTARRREGRYLLRSNLTDPAPAKLWQMYLHIYPSRASLQDLKGDLSVRPIYHQKDSRIEAHIMVSFLASCVHITLREKLRRHAPGLTPRQVLDHLAKLQMIDVHLPATDGRDFLQSLQKRGLTALQLLVSDDHAGLGAARRAVFPSIPWQRCQFHLQQNAQAYVPRLEMRA